jgi:hypothetical protein
MATTQLVLLGVPAYVVSVTSATACGFVIDELTYATANVIDVDLAKNTTLPPAQWAAGVDVDQQTGDGLTTIGPTFNAGPHVGAVYLADRLVQKYKSVLASWPPSPDATYQYQAVLRGDDGGDVERFHGFKVSVVSAAQGSLVQIAYIVPGQSAPSGTTRWIDLANTGAYDPKSNGFTTIDATSPVGTIGALFVSSAVLAEIDPTYPKLPRVLGW